MTKYFVDSINGANGNSGLSWALAKATLNAIEDLPIAAGDRACCHGVFREVVTLDVSGANAYSTGTVSVTKGSLIVTGAGTAWLANAAADYMFHVRYQCNGTDGVTAGTSAFSSVAGNFQAAMVGQIIQINTKGAYSVAAVTDSDNITLGDPNGLGWPTAGSGLTYSVMSGQGHHDIASVDGNGQLTLTEPWAGPTLTGLAYLTFNPIRYEVGDGGVGPDGVLAYARITGSDNDQTAARANWITATTKHYRVFQGFSFDMASGAGMNAITGCTDWIIRECVFAETAQTGIYVTGTMARWTIKGCVFLYRSSSGGYPDVYFTHTSDVDDAAVVLQNCLCVGIVGIRTINVGGVTVRSCAFLGRILYGFYVSTSPTVGQTVVANNCIISGAGVGMSGVIVGDITENFNTFFGCSTSRANTATGANSLGYPALLQAPLLLAGYKLPWQFGELSQWSQVRAIAGKDAPHADFFNIPRPPLPGQNSWGPIQFQGQIRNTAITRNASMASLQLPNAGRLQMFRPVRNVAITVSIWVQRGANYAGVNPQMRIKQPGQADRVTTDVGAAGVWNQLLDTFTPAAAPPFIVIEMVSNNVAVVGNYAVYWEDLR